MKTLKESILGKNFDVKEKLLFDKIPELYDAFAELKWKSIGTHNAEAKSRASDWYNILDALEQTINRATLDRSWNDKKKNLFTTVYIGSGTYNTKDAFAWRICNNTRAIQVECNTLGSPYIYIKRCDSDEPVDGEVNTQQHFLPIQIWDLLDYILKGGKP